MIGYLKNERDFVPWVAAMSGMHQQEYLLGDAEIVPEVQRYFLSLILPFYNSLGWTSINQSTDWREALLQPDVLSTVCHYGYRECIDSARSIFRRWFLNPTQNQILFSLRPIVYCVAIQEGSDEEFLFLWNRLKVEQVSSEVENLLHGLSCTRDRSRIVWFLNQHLKNQSVIREQDMPSSIRNVARSQYGYPITWLWLQENWSQLFAKWGKTDSGLNGIIEAVANRFVTMRQLNEFKNFADSIVDKGKSH